MESVALDPGVYIRSLATRGSLGGLSSATREVADVLDAFGFDRILIETVGVGQSELDVARAADTTVVVLVPESGDSIQTLKAGLMEIADIFVGQQGRSARRRPRAQRHRADARHARGRGAANVPAHHGVDLKTITNPGAQSRANAAATRADASRGRRRCCARWRAKGEGIGELVDALDRHFRYLEASGELRRRRRAAAARAGDRSGGAQAATAALAGRPRRTRSSRRRCRRIEAGSGDAVRDRRRAAGSQRPTF